MENKDNIQYQVKLYQERYSRPLVVALIIGSYLVCSLSVSQSVSQLLTPAQTGRQADSFNEDVNRPNQ